MAWWREKYSIKIERLGMILYMVSFLFLFWFIIKHYQYGKCIKKALKSVICNQGEQAKTLKTNLKASLMFSHTKFNIWYICSFFNPIRAWGSCWIFNLSHMYIFLCKIQFWATHVTFVITKVNIFRIRMVNLSFFIKL